MQRTPNLLEAAYEVNRFLLQERDLANLLQGVCDRLTGDGGSLGALLVLLDRDSGGVITAETGLEEVLAPLLDGLREGRLPRCGRRAMEGEKGVVVRCEQCDCGLCSPEGGRGDCIGITMAVRCTPSLTGFLALQFAANFELCTAEAALLGQLAETLGAALRQLFAEEEARQRQRELELIEERYELALHASQAGLWDWNIRTGEIYTSPDQWELLDYRADESGPTLPKRFIHPEDREQVLSVLNEHLAGKTDEYRIEYRVQEKTGEWTWFLDRGRVVERDNNNMPVRMTGTHQNITLQKRQDQAIALVQQQLHEAVNYERNFLQTVIDSAGDPVMVIDLNFHVLLINQAAARLVRNDGAAESLQGQVCYRLFCAADAPCRDLRFPCPVTEVREQGRQVKMIHNPFHGNGVPNTFELEVSPLYDRQGALYGIIEVARDITDRLRIEKELRENQSRLYRLAHHDSLTGLPNRLLFRDRLNQAVSKAGRNRSGVAVLFLDLDHFKEINDTLGHDVGDLLLIEVASRLQRQCRQSDTVARLGGDEFVFVLESITEHRDAGVVAAKIMAALAEPVEVGSHRLQISTSIGIALYPSDAATIDEVIKCADLALYAAKEVGRSNFQFYHRNLAENGKRPPLDAVQFKRAFAQEEMLVEYVPRYALDSGKLIGLQALLRWQHPVMGLLPADDFIPAAAETEMLAALGDWLFNRIANDVRHWQRRGKRCLPVHVRCDCRMLSDEPFFAMLLDSRQRYNLHPDLLAVELGERTFVESNGQLLASLVQLEQLGMGVGVSDFGAEPTLPSHLHQTPVRTVVLSRQLCRGDGDQIPSLRLIGALIAFCHALGITVVADGVDHEEQRGLLARLGCDQVQGSLLLTAVSGEEVEDLLEPA